LISIVTPVLNEEANVRSYLSHLDSLEGDFEVIVVDGGSSDGTLEELTSNMKGFGHRIRVLQSSRGRAVQMNEGAKRADGDVLLFLHADCVLPEDALVLVQRELHGKTIGGGFKQTFSDSDLFLKALSAIGNLIVGLTKIFFGDFGIFLRRDVFEKIGGYDRMIFLEDVEICRKAKRCGKLIQIDRPTYTSARRYAIEGRIRLNIVFALGWFLNMFGLRPYFLKRYIADR